MAALIFRCAFYLFASFATSSLNVYADEEHKIKCESVLGSKEPVIQKDGDLLPLSELESKSAESTEYHLQALGTEPVIRKSCEEAGYCSPGQAPSHEYRALHAFVRQVAVDFKESLFAFKGTALRASPVAFADFFKNLSVAWIGQLLGAMKLNGDLTSLSAGSLLSGLSNLTPNQHLIAMNTLAMIWTQSERGAQKTEKMRGTTKINSFSDLKASLKIAYKGNKGYWKEARERLIAFTTLIPFEMFFLTAGATVIAFMHPNMYNAANHLADMGQKVGFSALFGSYLALKWAFVQKPFDLRVLPMVREKFSRKWEVSREKFGLRVVDRSDTGEEEKDRISIAKLLTLDLWNFIRNKQFECNVTDECFLTSDPLEVSERAPRTQYVMRWNTYLKQTPLALDDSGIAGVTGHTVWYLGEASYRWANSLLDGYVVMWLMSRGMPMLSDLLFK